MKRFDYKKTWNTQLISKTHLRQSLHQINLRCHTLSFFLSNQEQDENYIMDDQEDFNQGQEMDKDMKSG